MLTATATLARAAVEVVETLRDKTSYSKKPISGGRDLLSRWPQSVFVKRLCGICYDATSRAVIFPCIPASVIYLWPFADCRKSPVAPLLRSVRSINGRRFSSLARRCRCVQASGKRSECPHRTQYNAWRTNAANHDA